MEDWGGTGHIKRENCCLACYFRAWAPRICTISIQLGWALPIFMVLIGLDHVCEIAFPSPLYHYFFFITTIASRSARSFFSASISSMIGVRYGLS